MKSNPILFVLLFLFSSGLMAQDFPILPFSKTILTDSTAIKLEIGKVLAEFKKHEDSNTLNKKYIKTQGLSGTVYSLHKRPVYVFYFKEKFPMWGFNICYFDENGKLRLWVNEYYSFGQWVYYYSYFTPEETPMKWTFYEAGAKEGEEEKTKKPVIPFEKRVYLFDKKEFDPVYDKQGAEMIRNSVALVNRSVELEKPRTGIHNFNMMLGSVEYGIMQLEVSADNKIKGQYMSQQEKLNIPLVGKMIEDRLFLEEIGPDKKIINSFSLFFASSDHLGGTVTGKISNVPQAVTFNLLEAYEFGAKRLIMEQ